MLEGVHVVPQVLEADSPVSAHHVEHVSAKGMSVPVDHVAVDGDVYHEVFGADGASVSETATARPIHPPDEHEREPREAAMPLR